MASSEVIQELAITAELCGAALSDAAAAVLVAELEDEREDDLLAGLRKMRREHRGRFTLADVLEFSLDARRERISKIRTCCWCPLPAVRDSHYCAAHTEHNRRIERGELRKIDAEALADHMIVARRGS